MDPLKIWTFEGVFISSLLISLEKFFADVPSVEKTNNLAPNNLLFTEYFGKLFTPYCPFFSALRHTRFLPTNCKFVLVGPTTNGFFEKAQKTTRNLPKCLQIF